MKAKNVSREATNSADILNKFVERINAMTQIYKVVFEGFDGRTHSMTVEADRCTIYDGMVKFFDKNYNCVMCLDTHCNKIVEFLSIPLDKVKQ